MKLTDIHNHILPGIDDGAKTLEEARKMISIAYKDGIRNIICTPHYHIGRVMTSIQDSTTAYRKLKAVVGQEFPDLHLFLGQEIFYYSEVLEKLKQDELLTLAGTDYILLEYSSITQYEMIRDSINEMYNAGFLPIIAHAERYPTLVKNFDKVRSLVKSGAYIQINAETLLKGFTDVSHRFAVKLLKENLVHFVASDAHSTNHRRPELKEACRYVERKFGQVAAKRIFIENTALLLDNREI